MSKIKVKICGLTRECDIEYANVLLPDYIGFVFAKSRRQVSPEQACNLKVKLDKKIKAVGVFVDEPIDTVLKIASEGIIDIIQLHGREDEIYIARLKEAVDKQIIKAYRIDTEKDISAAKQTKADMVLLDNGAGGTGKCFDWNLISELNIPYFLAGGIDTDNVSQALLLEPYAVDVSSGVETDGVKDFDKMKKIIESVRKV